MDGIVCRRQPLLSAVLAALGTRPEFFTGESVPGLRHDGHGIEFAVEKLEYIE